MPNSNWTTLDFFRTKNGTLERHIINYMCDDYYYLSEESANVTYTCVLGAKWIPEKPITCIKGTYIYSNNTFLVKFYLSILYCNQSVC